MNRPQIHDGRIVLTTFGSLGDLNPFIALAHGLQTRGFRPVIATSAYHRDAVRGAGLPFTPFDRIWIRMIRICFAGPCIHAGARGDLEGYCFSVPSRHLHGFGRFSAKHRCADHPFDQLCRPYRGRKRGLTWISVVLAPIVFLSAYDMPVLQGFPFEIYMGSLGPATNRLLIK